ncbi:MAG: 4'-phosphopantetheinyl transferase superfamily protein [Myxococcota bacterium]
MILGLGLSAVATHRFRSAEQRFGARLHGRLFTEGERAYAARKRRGFESLTVRFAAKLAAARALDLPTVPWQELEVVRRRGQPPQLAFHGGAARQARERGVARTQLSVTHDAGWCLAHVVLEGPA